MRFACFWLFLLLSLVSLSPAVMAAPDPRAVDSLAAAQPAQASDQATSEPAAEPQASGPPSIFDDGQPVRTENASIVVRVRTSRAKDVLDVFTLYPYPPKLPVCTPLPALPEKYKAVKNMVLSTGYRQRHDPDKPYQNGGWRWIYAYKDALKKSGRGEPHTILTEYPWANDVTPWVMRECTERNIFEKQRLHRYQKACANWERNHIDAENDAIRLGLMPIALSHREFATGRGHFPAGTWWLQVTRKMPGLTFYWMQPVTAVPGQNVEVVLDDDNALAVQGGW